MPPVPQSSLGLVHLNFLKFVFSTCSNFFSWDFSHSFRTTGDTFFGPSKNHFHIQKNNPCLIGEIVSIQIYSKEAVLLFHRKQQPPNYIFIPSFPTYLWGPLAHRQVLSHYCLKAKGGTTSRESLLPPRGWVCREDTPMECRPRVWAADKLWFSPGVPVQRFTLSVLCFTKKWVKTEILHLFWRPFQECKAYKTAAFRAWLVSHYCN